MRSVVLAVLSLGAALVAGLPLDNEEVRESLATRDELELPDESNEITHAFRGSKEEVLFSVLEVDPVVLPALARTKRNYYYNHGDPWGRDRIYGRQRYPRRRKNKGGKIRYFFNRKKNRNNQPSPELEEELNRPMPYTNEGPSRNYQPPASPPSSPRRPSGGFVSARTSGVAKVEQTVG